MYRGKIERTTFTDIRKSPEKTERFPEKKLDKYAHFS